MSRLSLVGHAHAFLGAAEEHVAAAERKDVDGVVDGMMAVIAMQNAVVGASKVLGAQDPSVLTCLSAVPDLKSVRDMITHFDDYASGAGRLQRSSEGSGGPFGWQPFWNSPATLLILVRKRGEQLPTEYSVELRGALLTVAALVRAAVVSIALGTSPLLERLAPAAGGEESPIANARTTEAR